MDTVTLSRAFFGTSLAFHIIFATLGIGLSLMILLFEILYQWKKDSDYAVMAKRWTKAFAILLGVAIPTGTIVGVQIALLWPGFAKIVGQVIAVPFQIEIFAFFLEALFMSIYVYAADKLSSSLRLLSLFFVMIGATASGILITSANTWMNTPAGFSMRPDGTVYDVNPWEAFFNPSFYTGASHVVITAYAAGAGVVAAVAGYKLLKRNQSAREIAYHKKGLLLSLIMTFAMGIMMWVTGHSSAINLHEHSPEKLAAAEGLFETQSHAPLAIGGFVDPVTQEVKYGIEIPWALSILTGLSPDTVVKGLNEFPPETWPPFYTHVFFNLMVGAAGWTTMISGLALAYWYFIHHKRGGKLPKWLLWSIASIGPVSMLGIEFGWIFSCSGRQPWTIYGFQRTTEAATRADFIAPMYMLFIVLYVFLSVLTVIVLRTFFRRHPLLPELEGNGGKV
ncbi:cytochrome ubiquinol oxidase subunit I [Ectobacillus antri]|jgi:cytochrome d ubiquinol oxidase subunit I|uniref:Cytochrome ubiquinol oxidase subunit I n=1 Tax=Ectobacillus antri TaxID=2486280 RepID=A0ABT6H7H5_9BACI|nr:cytochrome ubiquinol oxidase subunit I [Ectobacillus antri]MDG4657190.1 cytochrome ubiquinol oxidase subunit I [Ectobacillus antri]MDG5755203.1 cytochrome ubiquinol oxidase subunit I [Ectobacillus antri]